MKKIAYLPAIMILLFVMKQILSDTKKGNYYVLAIIAIFILSFFINSIPSEISSMLRGKTGEQNNIYNFARSIYNKSTKLVNPYTIVFSFVIIAFFTSVIGGLDSPNKIERGIWRTYQMSIGGIANFESIFEIDINDIDKVDKNCIKEKIKDVINSKEDKEINISTAIGSKNTYSTKELFEKTINEVKKETEFIMMTYIKYINDNLYKDVAQLNTNVSLYDFGSNQKLNEYNKEILSEYIYTLITDMIKLNEEWYKYYKPEIFSYNKENELNERYKVKDNESIRKRRIEKGMLIEEMSDNMDKFGGGDEEIKKEILYRMIENEKIKANKRDAQAISKQLGLDMDIIFTEIQVGK